LVSSQADGVYDIVDVPALSRAFTSAAAADVDGDGDVDVVLLMDSDTTPLQVLLNDGAGHFSLETGARLPAIGEGYYTMEFADVNGDGLLDVLVGGHELSGNRPTLVYVNPGDNRFANVVPIVVPKATDAAGADVLDFTVTGDTAHRTLWVLRSSHAGHQGRVIQRIDWSSLQSGQGVYTSVFNAPSGNAHWLAPAWVNGNLQLVSDDAAMNALMAQTLDLFL
jgi:hypothetical protein